MSLGSLDRMAVYPQVQRLEALRDGAVTQLGRVSGTSQARSSATVAPFRGGAVIATGSAAQIRATAGASGLGFSRWRHRLKLGAGHQPSAWQPQRELERAQIRAGHRDQLGEPPAPSLQALRLVDQVQSGYSCAPGS